ncbi:MAG: hypothetical protein JXL97_06960 [Bacteroidales bacterium]|nr:hypothetical protein [Bacteroidales bacterium]
MNKNIKTGFEDDSKKITEIEDQNIALKKIFNKLKSKYSTKPITEINQTDDFDNSKLKND